MSFRKIIAIGILATLSGNLHAQSVDEALALKLACQKQLMAFIQGDRFFFESIPGSGITTISKINDELKLSPFRISAFEVAHNKKKQTIVGLNLVKLNRRSNPNAMTYASIAEAEAASSNIFRLDLDYRRQRRDGTEVLSETWNVDRNCKLQVKDVSYIQFMVKNSRWIFRSIESHSGSQAGSEKTESRMTDLPVGATVLDFEFERYAGRLRSRAGLERLTRSKNNRFFLASTFPIVTIGLEKTGSTLRPDGRLNNRSQQMQNYRLQMIASGNLLVEVTLSYTPSLTLKVFGLAQGDGQDLILEEFETWSKSIISGSAAISSQTYRLDNGFGEGDGHVVVDFRSSHEFDYDNISAYWTLQSKPPSGGSEHWKFNYLGTPYQWPANEPTDPVIKNNSVQSPYLKESEFVQVNLPAIQQMTQPLRDGAPLDRLQMAKKIHEIVNQHLIYDTSVLNNDEVYILTTADILSRSNGVCQHFANLFTALARSVGLPTRMVSGRYMDGQGNWANHAWNEIEVRDGVWRPIEPQNPPEGGDPLVFNTAQYLPLAVGTQLESSKFDANFYRLLTSLAFLSFDAQFHWIKD